MRHNKINGLLLAAIFGVTLSCKDDSIELIPEWESGVHGLAEITSANTDFPYSDPATSVALDLQWVSIDQALTVTKIDVFVLFDEEYIDADGNPAVASHGGATGMLLKTYEGSAVPANRTPLNFTMSQSDLYALYSSATFDYGNGEVSVFNNPDNPPRDATHRFMWNDNIRVRWEFTTDDGRVFKKWGVSVCTEFPGANCAVDFGVVCASEIPDPQGTWLFDMVDTFGDGWQGGYISVVVDGEEAEQINIPSEYDGNPPLSALHDEFTFPTSGSTLSFEWFPDAYGVEVQFKITSPSGNVVADVADPPEGPIKLDLCLE